MWRWRECNDCGENRENCVTYPNRWPSMQKTISPYIQQLRNRNWIEIFNRVYCLQNLCMTIKYEDVLEFKIIHWFIWIIRFLHRIIFACWSHRISFTRRISNVDEINYNEFKLQLASFLKSSIYPFNTDYLTWKI